MPDKRRKLGLENVLDEFIKKNDWMKQADPKNKMMQLRLMYQSMTQQVKTWEAASANEGTVMPTKCIAVFLANYMNGDAHIYKVASRFGAHLHKTTLDISCSMIPFVNQRVYWIEFPESLVFEKKGC